MPIQSEGATSYALPHLEGRERDVGFVAQLLDRIHQGGATLIVSGEPGIGKSALLEIAKIQARERGISVLAMTGVPEETHLPFAGLEQVLRPLLKQLDGLAPRQRSALLAAFGMQDDDAAPPDNFLVGLATLSLLTESASRKPILLVADDGQWIDQPTYDVLAFVARRLSSDPIVLLMAMRDGSNRTFGDAGALRLRLSALDEADAERVLDASAPGLVADVRRRFLREAAGNPLALLELPRAGVTASVHDASWLPLTERLERVFSSRLSELPQATQEVLLIAAENDATLLHEVLRAHAVLLGRHVGVDVLSPAISAKLIEIDGAELRFAHPLVRSAMHQAADHAMRLAIHAALAEVIQDQLDRKLWHRALATLGWDDELAEQHELMAARAQRRGAVLTAIDVLERAARLSSTAKSKSDRLLWAAELAAELGRPELLDRLLCQADVDKSDQLAAARIGWCREISQPPSVNDPARVPALLGFAAQADSAGAKSLASNLVWRAAQRSWWSDAPCDVRDNILAAERKLNLAAMDPRSIAIAAYVEPLKNGSEAHAKLQKLSAKDSDDPVIAQILGSTADVVGAFDLGVNFLTKASAALREQGRLSDLARVLFAQAWAEVEVGDWIGAIREADEAVRFAEEVGQPLWIAAATIVKAKVAGMQGNVELSQAHATLAERLILASRPRFLLAMLQLVRGIAALGAGQHSTAHEHLQRLFTPEDPTFNSGLQFFGIADFAEAAAYSNNTGAALLVIDELERASGPTPVPWVGSMLLYARALLTDQEHAEQFFTRGLNAAANRFPFLRGRLLLAYGGWLRRQRRSANARAPLREARDIFDVLGASPWGMRAREELRASGESSRPRTERTLDALTPQELHISQLAAEGLSNKEIAARLYLSHRTVGYHLHRIFSKTGITSRSALGPLLSAL